MAQSIADLYVLYRVVKDISTPFKDTDAFKLGLIDATGTKLKKAETPDEKDALSYYNRFVFNLKRIMSKANLDNQIATYAGALFLLKENNLDKFTDKEILAAIEENIAYLSKFNEEVIPNVTGANVPGTGDDVAHWKDKGRPRVKGKPINGVAFLKRMRRKYNG